MRKAMDNWQETYGDMGAIPERELIYDVFWKGPFQPVTENVQFEIIDGKMRLYCATPGSSIAWRIKGEGDPDQWRLYIDTISVVKNKTIEAQSVRIGYKHSLITEISN